MTSLPFSFFHFLKKTRISPSRSALAIAASSHIFDSVDYYYHFEKSDLNKCIADNFVVGSKLCRAWQLGTETNKVGRKTREIDVSSWWEYNVSVSQIDAFIFICISICICMPP